MGQNLPSALVKNAKQSTPVPWFSSPKKGPFEVLTHSHWARSIMVLSTVHIGFVLSSLGLIISSISKLLNKTNMSR